MYSILRYAALSLPSPPKTKIKKSKNQQKQHQKQQQQTNTVSLVSKFIHVLYGSVVISSPITFLPVLVVGPFAVIQPPKIRTVNEGENVSLTCDASGLPNPMITWTKVGESKVLFVGRTYTIVNISRVAGNTLQYQCTASNGVEHPVYDRANVTVQCEYFDSVTIKCATF